MEANLKNALVELKHLIEHLSVSERWSLLKWLIELLQQEPQSSALEKTQVNLARVEQICDRIRSLPILDSRSPDEIIGYNEFGGLD